MTAVHERAVRVVTATIDAGVKCGCGRITVFPRSWKHIYAARACVRACVCMFRRRVVSVGCVCVFVYVIRSAKADDDDDDGSLARREC